jgi:hypothetical protein
MSVEEKNFSLLHSDIVLFNYSRWALSPLPLR